MANYDRNNTIWISEPAAKKVARRQERQARKASVRSAVEEMYEDQEAAFAELKEIQDEWNDTEADWIETAYFEDGAWIEDDSLDLYDEDLYREPERTFDPAEDMAPDAGEYWDL